MVTDYRPNLNDERVRIRIKMALTFADNFLSPTKAKGWASTFIQSWIGGHDLGQYLSRILICTSHGYEVGVRCKEYIRDDDFCNHLRALLSPYISSDELNVEMTSIILDDMKSKHSEELSTLIFHYSEKSHRYFHPIQNIKKENRNKLMVDHGLYHDYDIESCAFVLIRQLARACGVTDRLDSFDEYLENKQQIRELIADVWNIPVDTAKTILHALLFGAKPHKHKACSIYTTQLKRDSVKLETLRAWDWIAQLRKDLDVMWDAIRDNSNLVTVKTKKKQRKNKPEEIQVCTLSPKEKVGIYFRLEHIVITAIHEYLDMTKNKHFLIHDGFVCAIDLDTDELQCFISRYTGFDIQLKYKDLRDCIRTDETASAHSSPTSESVNSNNIIEIEISDGTFLNFKPTMDSDPCMADFVDESTDRVVERG